MTVLGILAVAGCTPLSKRNEAESLAQQGKFAEAIVAYEQHISDREKENSKPNWENPHFYDLIIADLELKQGNIPAAKARLKIAEEKKVDRDLILDRVLTIASAIAKQHGLNDALDYLDEYRNWDELYIDGVTDRLGKEALAGQ